MGKTSKKAMSVDDINLPTFPPRDFRVSKNSVYKDDKWDLRDDTDVRLKGHSEAKLTVDWSTYRFDSETHRTLLSDVLAPTHLDARVSDGVIEDVRLLCFVQLEMPSVFGRRGRQIERSKPPTIVSMARALVVLFSVVDMVRAERLASVALGLPYTPLQSISEITYQDLESALKKYPFVDGQILNKSLRALASPVLRGKFSGASVQWTEGGGAEEFRQRRKVYFDGRVAEGWTQDEIIDQLAACGSPFVNVGPGYCGGVREQELADGTKRPPPCIGNLQCNTGDCDNAVVTQIHVTQWKDIVVKNKELASDPRLAHAVDNFKAAISTGERVLRDLGINPATL